MDRHYLLVSDFDQTLSFQDSGHALCEMLGIAGFGEKVAGLAALNLVQQGRSWRTCSATTPNSGGCDGRTWSASVGRST